MKEVGLVRPLKQAFICSLYVQQVRVPSDIFILICLVFFLFDVETPGDQIVRKLTFDRIEELKKSIRNDQQTYK